jgi:ribosomal protein L24E
MKADQNKKCSFCGHAIQKGEKNILYNGPDDSSKDYFFHLKDCWRDYLLALIKLANET